MKNQSSVYPLLLAGLFLAGCAKDAPIPDFNIINNGCTAPCTVEFENLTTGKGSHEWTFGDGTGSDLKSPEHIYNTPGVYNVQLYSANNAGSNSIMKQVTIMPPYDKPVADFIHTYTGGNDYYFVNFINQSSGEEITSYYWDLGDGNVSYSQTPDTKTYYSGSFTVRLIVTNAAGSDTATRVISLRPLNFSHFRVLELNVTGTHTPLANFDFGLGNPDNYGDPYLAVYNSGGTSQVYNATGVFYNVSAYPFIVGSPTTQIAANNPSETFTVQVRDFDTGFQPDDDIMGSFEFMPGSIDDDAVYGIVDGNYMWYVERAFPNPSNNFNGTVKFVFYDN